MESDKNIQGKEVNTKSNYNSYNPWNLFKPRNRSDSEHSISSNSSTSSLPAGNNLQRQTSKEEEYLWMMWRS